MSSMQIDRLLDTVVRLGASDLHLTVGRRPTIRLHGDLRDLQTKILDSEDMVSLMKAITPERNQQELQEEGGSDFGFAYGDAARFRVSVFRQRGDLAICCRQIPNKLLTFEQIGLPEVVRDLIRRDKERVENEAFERLKAALTLAFAAPEDSYRPLTAADVIARNRR